MCPCFFVNRLPGYSLAALVMVERGIQKSIADAMGKGSLGGGAPAGRFAGFHSRWTALR